MLSRTIYADVYTMTITHNGRFYVAAIREESPARLTVTISNCTLKGEADWDSHTLEFRVRANGDQTTNRQVARLEFVDGCASPICHVPSLDDREVRYAVESLISTGTLSFLLHDHARARIAGKVD